MFNLAKSKFRYQTTARTQARPQFRLKVVIKTPEEPPQTLSAYEQRLPLSSPFVRKAFTLSEFLILQHIYCRLSLNKSCMFY